jgi:putative transposase
LFFTAISGGYEFLHFPRNIYLGPADSWPMRPRCYLPGSIQFVTRRCSQRKYLLQPGKLTNQLFLYALANAARRTHVQIMGFCVMSNHYHLVVHDKHGNMGAFLQYLNGFVSRSCNAAFGRKEHFWSSDEPCVVELLTRQDVIEKLAYTLANPVDAGLVGRASAWFGASSWKSMVDDTDIEVHRPLVFYRKRSPEKAVVRLQLPKRMGARVKFFADVVAEVRKIEQHCDAVRSKHGATVKGRAGVMKQHREESPTTRGEMFGLRPRVASRSEWHRIATLQRNSEFERLHSEARKRLLAGEVANFPIGTVAMYALIGPVPPPPRPPMIEVFALAA